MTSGDIADALEKKEFPRGSAEDSAARTTWKVFFSSAVAGLSPDVTDPNGRIAFARASLKRYRQSIKLLRQLVRLRLFFADRRTEAAFICSITALLLALASIASLRAEGNCARTLRDFHHVAARTKLGHIFFQNDFHRMTPFLKV